MTRETKIGLLVGLAFIILFGIILSEKGSGTDAFNTPPMTAYSKPVVEVVPATGVGRVRPDRPSPRARLTPDTRVPDTSTVEQPPAETTAESDDIERKVQPQPVREEMSPKLKRLLELEPSKAVAKIPASAPPLKTPAEFKPVTLTARRDVKPEAAPSETVRRGDDILAEHQVELGETLVGICRKYYPGRAYNMLKKVMAFNDITDPKRLLEGQTLRLPRPADQAPPVTEESKPKRAPVKVAASELPAEKFVAVPGRIPAPRKSSTSSGLVVSTIPAPTTTPKRAEFVAVQARETPKSTSTRWYVVQAKDSLGKIARIMYGSESKWKRVFEANKDIIKDPNVIRTGLKIRLPKIEDGLAAGERVE